MTEQRAKKHQRDGNFKEEATSLGKWENLYCF